MLFRSALAKKRFVGRQFLFTLIVCAMALPKQVILIPLLREMSSLNLYNTIWAVIFPIVGWPFGVFLMTQFFKAIPKEIDEAALLDNASRFKIFWKVLLPLTLPAQATLGILTFLGSWNNFLWPLVVTNSVETRPITVGLQVFATIEQGGTWNHAGVALTLTLWLILGAVVARAMFRWIPRV